MRELRKVPGTQKAFRSAGSPFPLPSPPSPSAAQLSPLSRGRGSSSSASRCGVPPGASRLLHFPVQLPGHRPVFDDSRVMGPSCPCLLFSSIFSSLRHPLFRRHLACPAPWPARAFASSQTSRRTSRGEGRRTGGPGPTAAAARPGDGLARAQPSLPFSQSYYSGMPNARGVASPCTVGQGLTAPWGPLGPPQLVRRALLGWDCRARQCGEPAGCHQHPGASE